mmetsp:Transcript_100272/g.323560  ORF Transcript_100272/g.323560 Transcript_100272/m.323560 type:complete len:207 (-) Transcript_100272:330-950(-)
MQTLGLPCLLHRSGSERRLPRGGRLLWTQASKPPMCGTQLCPPWSTWVQPCRLLPQVLVPRQATQLSSSQHHHPHHRPQCSRFLSCPLASDVCGTCLLPLPQKRQPSASTALRTCKRRWNDTLRLSKPWRPQLQHSKQVCLAVERTAAGSRSTELKCSSALRTCGGSAAKRPAYRWNATSSPCGYMCPASARCRLRRPAGSWQRTL